MGAEALVLETTDGALRGAQTDYAGNMKGVRTASRKCVDGIDTTELVVIVVAKRVGGAAAAGVAGIKCIETERTDNGRGFRFSKKFFVPRIYRLLLTYTATVTTAATAAAVVLFCVVAEQGGADKAGRRTAAAS